MTERLKKALDKIDQFNSRDPNHDMVDGISFPRELLYSKRLNDWVLRLNPEASEALRVAARGQHIGRWTIPRGQYEMDRGGYLRWREALKSFHAKTVGAILVEAGYEQDFIQRVQSLILKKNIKQDPEAQTLEDALCLVFLETQFNDLRDKTPDPKMKDIVRKTWKKMGAQGQEAALKLNLSDDVKQFLKETLSGA
jgi:hypothetical protein